MAVLIQIKAGHDAAQQKKRSLNAPAKG